MGRTTGWLIGGLLAGGLVAGSVARRWRAYQHQQAHNRYVRVLIVGAGVVGSSYAVRLARWGMDVTLLARGRRLRELRMRGLWVQDALTRQFQTARLRVVSAIQAAEDYDLVIVAVRYNQVLEALDAVQPLSETTPVLVLQNNPVGAQMLAERLGDRQLLMGFPATGGSRRHGLVRSLPLWLGTTVIGESDGADTQRLHQAASILRRAGLRVEHQRQIQDWLKTHAAMMVALAGAVYRNDGRIRQMVQRSDEVDRYLAALREAYTVLEANGVPVTPRNELAVFARPSWMQQLVLFLAGHMPWVSTVIDEYLDASAEEMHVLYEQLLTLARRASLATPSLASLGPYLARE